MIDYKTLLLSPKGRVGRQTFLTATVGLVAANLVLNLVPVLGSVLALPLLWPFACITAKRLHDGGRSAWPVVLVTALCVTTGAIAAATGLLAADPTPVPSAFALAAAAIMLGGFAMVAAIALLIWAATVRGDSGSNRFGAPEPMPLRLTDLLARDPAGL